MNTTHERQGFVPTDGDDAKWLALTLCLAVRGGRATGGDSLEEPTLTAALLVICHAYGLEPGEAMGLLGLEPGDVERAFAYRGEAYRGR